MLREMMKPKCKGQTVEIDLTEWGYQNYIIECTYYFNKYEKNILFQCG